MPVNEQNLCMGCMTPKFEGGKCSVCGFDPDSPVNIDFLPPRTVIVERYLVGALVASDPEGAWYVGYDRKEDMRVWLREYAPSNIIRRDRVTLAVQPLASAEAQYKALMADFEDLSSTLRTLGQHEKVLPVLDIVRDYNTVYAVYRYIKTISLESFLERSGGKLSWRHTKKLLMPLFHTVENVHKAGLIHRGLSPRTIHLDQTGALWLTCFTIAAARTNKSELKAQLFDGYSAPEQYSLNSWQGTWTDVYALGALTYRAVTGGDPPAALDRVYGDDLLDAGIAGGDLTETVIAAANHALAVEVDERTPTVEAMIASFLSNEASNTAIYTAAPKRQPYEPAEQSAAAQESMQAAQHTQREIPLYTPAMQPPEEDGGDLLLPSDDGWERPAHAGKKSGKGGKRKVKKSHPVLMLFLSALIATALLGGALYWFATTYLEDLLSPAASRAASEVSSPAAQEGVDFSQGDTADDTVPRFVGANVDSVKSNEQLNSRYEFTYQEKYDDVYEAGVVCDQQPVEGTKMPNRGMITLYVSKGPEKMEIPEDAVGMRVEDLLKQLSEMEIKYQVIEKAYSEDYEPNTVVSTDPAPGSKIDKENDTVFVYIKKITESRSSRDERDDKELSSSRKPSDDTSSRKLRPKSENGFYNEDGAWVEIID
ncbi:PASTA domain-containing protein [Anaerotruncus colihominis]|uniref:PASTA domain-containing protein n=1 Tax=Anaerotruncus colihominis TaxID=169435 RepID=UPI003516B41F